MSVPNASSTAHAQPAHSLDSLALSLPTMCTNTTNDTLNALHLADDEDAICLTLEYGAFMN